MKTIEIRNILGLFGKYLSENLDKDGVKYENIIWSLDAMNDALSEIINIVHVRFIVVPFSLENPYFIIFDILNGLYGISFSSSCNLFRRI